MIALIEMVKSAHCETLHSLDGILNCVDVERKLSNRIYLLLLDVYVMQPVALVTNDL